MKYYKPTEVKTDVPGIILLSHGPFAVSLVETAKMIFGEADNLAAFSLEAGDDLDEYRHAISETLEAFPEGSIMLLDLFGGTPCNQVMRYVQETGKTPDVVAGMNLPMLVQVVMSRMNHAGKSLAQEAEESGKAQVFRIDTEDFLKNLEEDED